jgi:hypothetical protein
MREWIKSDQPTSSADLELAARKPTRPELKYRDEKTDNVLGLPSQVGEMKTYAIVSHTKSMGKISVHFPDEKTRAELQKLPRNKKHIFGPSIPANEKMKWAKITVKNLLAARPRGAIIQINNLDVWNNVDKELPEAILLYCKHHNLKYPADEIHIVMPKEVKVSQSQIEFYDKVLQISPSVPDKPITKSTGPTLPYQLKIDGL